MRHLMLTARVWVHIPVLFTHNMIYVLKSKGISSSIMIEAGRQQPRRLFSGIPAPRRKQTASQGAQREWAMDAYGAFAWYPVATSEPQSLTKSRVNGGKTMV